MNSEEDKSISALDSCRAAEAKIQEAQRLLSVAGREGLDHALNLLDQAIALLETVVSLGPDSLGPRTGSPALLAAFHRIKRSARMVGLQTEFASNFWQGWLQRRVGTGYTEQGLPVFVDHGAKSFEG
jgi:hypothetical protein